MNNISIDMSNSAYQRLVKLGLNDPASVTRILSAAMEDYLHRDIGWTNVPSYPMKDQAQSNSPLSFYLNELGVGMLANQTPVAILDGDVYKLNGDSTARKIPGDVPVPLVMTVAFDAEPLRNDFECLNIDALVNHCQNLKAGKNIFYALRADGQFRFATVRSSIAAAAGPGAGDTSRHYYPNKLEDIKGTIIGFWSSRFTSSVCAPGYHFYFLSPEVEMGGAVVDCSGTRLRMLGMPVTRLRGVRPDGPNDALSLLPTEVANNDLPVVFSRGR